jgi:hypothetical protein
MGGYGGGTSHLAPRTLNLLFFYLLSFIFYLDPLEPRKFAWVYRKVFSSAEGIDFYSPTRVSFDHAKTGQKETHHSLQFPVDKIQSYIYLIGKFL